MPSGTGSWKRDLDFQMMNKRTYMGAEEQKRRQKQSAYIASVIHGDDPSDCFCLFSLYLQVRFQGSKQADIQDSRYICRLEQISL